MGLFPILTALTVMRELVVGNGSLRSRIHTILYCLVEGHGS